MSEVAPKQKKNKQTKKNKKYDFFFVFLLLSCHHWAFNRCYGALDSTKKFAFSCSIRPGLPNTSLIGSKKTTKNKTKNARNIFCNFFVTYNMTVFNNSVYHGKISLIVFSTCSMVIFNEPILSCGLVLDLITTFCHGP